tara:strand:+ start:194 stop:481 length:288 start_codon:yes stop_codon:yes gene_type:complete
MFVTSKAGFDMFNRAVARRDVPTDYYSGGIFDGLIEVCDEYFHCAIAHNKNGWAIYPLNRNPDNTEDGPRHPLFGLYFDTAEEAGGWAASIAYKS